MVLPKRTLLIGGGILAVIVVYSSSQAPPGSTETGQTDTTCRVEVTADVLNVRVAPDGGAEVVGKFKLGAESDAGKTVQNGFRQLGDNRWASSEFLKPMAGRDCG
ncbi:SH3 domain-containing protein [Actinokineospora sp. PR83]|uniref:SH3 domain-containing protein n=1 Tax=Actinokineospora sp. PR83 TaxID=2884908 RepID=UPI0027E15965|nr:SH3 domain-containing protein [Actinokineospora sp. PR83]MCG8918964.1 SH3 domain-containing protein [Actinokineospora sp. PR83]